MKFTPLENWLLRLEMFFFSLPPLWNSSFFFSFVPCRFPQFTSAFLIPGRGTQGECCDRQHCCMQVSQLLSVLMRKQITELQKFTLYRLPMVFCINTGIRVETWSVNFCSFWGRGVASETNFVCFAGLLRTFRDGPLKDNVIVVWSIKPFLLSVAFPQYATSLFVHLFPRVQR